MVHGTHMEGDVLGCKGPPCQRAERAPPLGFCALVQQKLLSPDKVPGPTSKVQDGVQREANPLKGKEGQERREPVWRKERLGVA